MSGSFITFEGLDGSGKTTQMRRLAAWLTASGRTVVSLRQPGSTALGDRLRAVLLDSRSESALGPISPLAEMALMFADRAQAIAEVIQPALDDPEAVPYIGAVDFHSWRGCTDEILAQWRDAARELNVPLVVAEGSTDAAAYRYPQIFNEQSFALYEINLYLRILAIAQPRSILQWQLTADYSILAGGGIFNDQGPLRPTRRFWNLKQLAATPPRSFSLPVACNKSNLTCAAFGNIAEGIYTVHIVNNGATRTATLTGLPPNVRQMRLWVTGAEQGIEESGPIAVTGGQAQFALAATSYTTVIGGTE